MAQVLVRNLGKATVERLERASRTDIAEDRAR